MNSKKAKLLRRLSKAIAEQTGAPDTGYHQRYAGSRPLLLPPTKEEIAEWEANGSPEGERPMAKPAEAQMYTVTLRPSKRKQNKKLKKAYKSLKSEGALIDGTSFIRRAGNVNVP